MTQIELEMQTSSLLRDLDDLVAMAANPATAAMVYGEIKTVNAICVRAQLLQNFMLAAEGKPASAKLRLVGR